MEDMVSEYQLTIVLWMEISEQEISWSYTTEGNLLYCWYFSGYWFIVTVFL